MIPNIGGNVAGAAGKPVDAGNKTDTRSPFEKVHTAIKSAAVSHGQSPVKTEAEATRQEYEKMHGK